MSPHSPETTRPPSTPWVSRPRPNRAALHRIFCLPYAGGGASIYRNWPVRLPPSIEACLIQLPGREARFRDRPFTRMAPLIDALEENLAGWLDLPFAFFGHSLGALIAFELSRRLCGSAATTPVCLFVSGCRAPRSAILTPGVYELPDEEFLDHLSTRYQAIPQAVRQNKELTNLVLPTLRADFELLGTYVYRDDAPLSCPIVAYGGTEDDTVSADDLTSWADYTSAPFCRRIFPGEHFFLRTAEADVLEAVAERLTTTSTQH